MTQGSTPASSRRWSSPMIRCWGRRPASPSSRPCWPASAAWVLSNRCWPTPRSVRSWSTGAGRCTSNATVVSNAPRCTSTKASWADWSSGSWGRPGRGGGGAAPGADGRLLDGSRVNVVVPPIAIDGACVTIRRFGTHRFTLADLAGLPVVELLRTMVRERANIVVSGATGSGKTTLLGALAGEVDPVERLVTVEDAAELAMDAPHVVRLEARPPNCEGVGEVTVRDLVRNALRMRPDRIVVGEVRGAEAFDMLQALNTGHDGSLSTCHANSAADAFRRLSTMVLVAAPGLSPLVADALVAGSVDCIVHMGRCGPRRFVRDVLEIRPPGSEPATRPAVADGRPVEVDRRPGERWGR